MKIYIDADFKCHTEDDGTLTAVESDFFNGKCRSFIEGHRYIPEGKVWESPDGTVFDKEMVCPWKPSSELEAAQAQYEADHAQMEDMETSLLILSGGNITPERSLELRPVMEQAAQSLEDAVALTAVELYPRWKELAEEGCEVEKGFRFQHEDKLYRTEQPKYTFVNIYVPGRTGTESLFSKVDESHSGTISDPIPYETNMEIYQNLYYSQYGVVYRCIRSSGQPLYHDLAVLVGLYVEVA